MTSSQGLQKNCLKKGAIRRRLLLACCLPKLPHISAYAHKMQSASLLHAGLLVHAAMHVSYLRAAKLLRARPGHTLSQKMVSWALDLAAKA